VRTTRFWNNHDQARSNSKDWKTKLLKLLWALKQKSLNMIEGGEP